MTSILPEPRGVGISSVLRLCEIDPQGALGPPVRLNSVPSIRLAAAQLNPLVGDLLGNAEKVLSAMGRAEAAGCDLVAFPELILTGYPPEDLLLKDGFVDDAVAVLERIAAASKECVAIIGAVVPAGFAGLVLADPADARPHARRPLANAAVICHRGRIIDVVTKRLLPNYAVFDERRWFLPGTGVHPLFRIAGGVIGITVCEDLWSANGPAKNLADEGAQLVVSLNASPFSIDQRAERREVLSARVAETGAAVLYVNQVGGQDELVFDGGSLLLDDAGSIRASSPSFVEDLLIADLELHGSDLEVSQALHELSGASRREGPADEGDVTAPLSDEAEIYEALVLTTGNKSEMATGYSTLYGDSAGGFAVIKDVPKTLVYDLCRYRNERARAQGALEPIPVAVIEKPPSAELRPDQKDVDSLPPYELLDPILAAYVEADRTAPELIAEGHDPELVARVARLVDLAEYKRRQNPPGVRITSKAFGKDRRMPITNRYRP